MKRFILSLLIILFFTSCSMERRKETKFYGNVDVRTLSLAFRVSGRIESISFDEGQKVKKGDVIAKLENSIYKEYLNEIDAEILVQEAKLQKLQKGYRFEEIKKAEAKLHQIEIEEQRLKKDFERVETLYKTNSISEQNYDNAKAAYLSASAEYEYSKSSFLMLKNGYEKEDILAAKANLAALKAKRALRKIDLEDTTLYSPTNGAITTRVYEKGSIVQASQTVVEIAKDEEFWVRSYMSERYLGLIKSGSKAKIYTDSKKVYEGRVSFISPIAEFTPKSVQTEDLRTELVYRFRVVLDSFDDSIRQGMPVTITFLEIDFDN